MYCQKCWNTFQEESEPQRPQLIVVCPKEWKKMCKKNNRKRDRFIRDKIDTAFLRSNRYKTLGESMTKKEKMEALP